MRHTPLLASHLHRARSAPGRARGFTLIELMVVVAIIGVVGALIMGLSSTTYTANPRSVADQINATMSFAKMRAVSSRRWHRVQVTGPAAPVPNTVYVWQWSNYGMAIPNPATCNPGPPAVNCWQLVEQNTLPASTVVRGATLTPVATAGTVAVTENTALDFNFDFRPDGSATGGTLYLDSKSRTQPYRIVVYPATGSSYARANW